MCCCAAAALLDAVAIMIHNFITMNLGFSLHFAISNSYVVTFFYTAKYWLAIPEADTLLATVVSSDKINMLVWAWSIIQ